MTECEINISSRTSNNSSSSSQDANAFNISQSRHCHHSYQHHQSRRRSRSRSHLSRCFLAAASTALFVLLLPGTSSSAITGGSSLTAQDPINTSPTGVEEAGGGGGREGGDVSHTDLSPPPSPPPQPSTLPHRQPPSPLPHPYSTDGPTTSLLLRDAPIGWRTSLPDDRRRQEDDNDDDDGGDKDQEYPKVSSTIALQNSHHQYHHPSYKVSSSPTSTTSSPSPLSSSPSPPVSFPDSPQIPHQHFLLLHRQKQQSSTSLRLLQLSSLDHTNPKARPSSYVMKEYIPRKEPYRVASTSSFKEPRRAKVGSSLPKKSFLLNVHHLAPYPSPSLPPSSPPPLVPLWPDPPPSLSPSFITTTLSTPSSHSPPPPVLSPDPQSSTTVSLDQYSTPPEGGGSGRPSSVSPDLNIPGARQMHSRIPDRPSNDPPQPQPLGFGSSRIMGIRASNLRLGRDKKRTFLQTYKLFSQEREAPTGGASSRSSGNSSSNNNSNSSNINKSGRGNMIKGMNYNQAQIPIQEEHMDEQNYPELPFPEELFYPKSNDKEKLERKDLENTSEVLLDKMKMATTTIATFLNDPLEDWGIGGGGGGGEEEDRPSENLPLPLDEGDMSSMTGNLKNEFTLGMQLGEGSTTVTQRRGDEENAGVEAKAEKEKEESSIPDHLDNREQENLGSVLVTSSHQTKNNNDDGDERLKALPDVYNHNANHNNDNDVFNETSPSSPSTTTEAYHKKVNLEKLEKELSKKDEDTASDLLLAISILQHHMIPSLQNEGTADEVERGNNISTAADAGYIGGNDGDVRENSHQRNHAPGEELQKGYQRQHNYNVEIFDTVSASSSEDDDNDERERFNDKVLEETGYFQNEKDESRGKSNDTIIFQTIHEVPLLSDRQACFRWFVLVLDGNCSVIKQRMATFVTFLKAALSSKLSIDYDDVYVPSVFCDTTFMVNISIDTVKNPLAEMKLRILAEANTTLLEISEEIFYLEKVLTKRMDNEEQEMQPLIKKPDDVELVIYIAVGCMCVFILLSVVIVALIRVCRQDGDPLDIGKTIPHQHLARPFDFPIRRPNVIYSHRFSQALTPDKCVQSTPPPPPPPPAAAHRRMEHAAHAASGPRSGIGVMAVTGSGRGSVLRYDTQFAGELMIGDDDFYSLGSPMEDPYNDRRSLVPSRRRTTKVPEEDVIMEEDTVEEEEEEEEEEEDEDLDDEVDEDLDVKVVDDITLIPIAPPVGFQGDEKDDKDEDPDDDEHCHFHISETRNVAESTGRLDPTFISEPKSCKDATDTAIENWENSENLRKEIGNGRGIANDGHPPRPFMANQSHSRFGNMVGTCREPAYVKSNLTTAGRISSSQDTSASHDDNPCQANMAETTRDSNGSSNSNRGIKACNRAKEILGSRLRPRRNISSNNEVVFTGIDNPCYNR